MDDVVVIGFDGSHHAERAIDFAASQLQPALVVVVGVWHVPVVIDDKSSDDEPPPDDEQHLEEAAARETAETGATRARDAGREAEVVVREGAGSSGIARQLLEVADERDARLVVVGRRGLGRIRSAVLGSVSESVVRHSRRPVLVVPDTDDAEVDSDSDSDAGAAED